MAGPFCDNFIMTEDGENFEMTQTTKGDPGEGVPTGGTAGQVLKKVSDDDYDTEWADNDAGDVGYDSEETYQSGTVGKTLNDLSRQLSDLTDVVSTTQIINSASGAIASFDDGADGQPIKKLVANIDPVQDLNGYANPWPAGGGKNLFHTTGTDQTRSGVTYTVNSDGTVLVNGTSTRTDPYTVGTVDLVGGTAYVISSSATNDSAFYLQAIGDGIVSINTISGAMTFTPLADMTATIRIVVSSGKAVSNVTIKPMICLSTATDPTVFAPYSNICPISGWTGAEIEQTGKNLLPKAESKTHNGVQYVANSDGSITVSGTSTGIAILDIGRNLTVLKAGEYVASISGSNAVVTIFKIVNDVVSVIRNGIGTFTLAEDTSVFMRLSFASGTLASGTAYPQIELGSTATSYAPYTGNQISVTFPTEAGTVYGGTLTLNPDRTGTLVVDRICHTYKGGTDSIVSSRSYDPNNRCMSIRAGSYPHATTDNGTGSLNINKPMCDKLPSVIFNSISSVTQGFASQGNWAPAVALKVQGCSTDAEYDAWCLANEPQISWILATPITYQLTESEISGILETLYGTNNIWADTGDIAECEHPADTKLYIDGKIADAIASLNS